MWSNVQQEKTTEDSLAVDHQPVRLHLGLDSQRSDYQGCRSLGCRSLGCRFQGYHSPGWLAQHSLEPRGSR